MATIVQTQKLQTIISIGHGFVESFDRIYQEYKIFRRAKTIKLYITGAPGVGKTYYATKLSEQLHIPVINLQTLIPEFQENQNLPLAEKCRAYLEENRQRMVDEAREVFEKEKAKKKKSMPDTFDESAIVAKLSDELLYEVVKYRQNMSDCLNRGYILDGFPKSNQDAYDLFVNRTEIQAPKVEAEDGEVQEPQFQEDLNLKIIPQCVVNLTAPDDWISQSLQKNVPAESLATSHLNAENLARRSLVWKGNNVYDEKLKNTLQIDFFKDWRFDILEFALDSTEESEIIEKTVSASDKEVAEYEPPAEKAYVEEVLEEDEEEEGEKKEEEEVKSHAGELTKEQIEEIKKHELNILNQKSQALKQYITDNVLPALTMGLIKICNNKPDDPLNFLADFQIEHGSEN